MYQGDIMLIEGASRASAQFHGKKEEKSRKSSPNSDASQQQFNLSTLWMCYSYLDPAVSIVTGQGEFEKPQTSNTCLFLISALTSDFA